MKSFKLRNMEKNLGELHYEVNRVTEELILDCKKLKTELDKRLCSVREACK